MFKRIICVIWNHKIKGRGKFYEHTFPAENGYATTILFNEHMCQRCGEKVTYEAACTVTPLTRKP